MSIATYADLKTAVANWLLRADLTSRIPEFIALAEGRISFGSKEPMFQSEPLRIRSMETSADITISARTGALPTGYVQGRRIYLSSTGAPVELAAPDDIWRKYGDASGTGTPVLFAAEGDNLIFGPPPDTTYTGKLLYYKTFTALAADGDTNWLLTNRPNAYLQGALTEAFRYIRNTEKAMDCLGAFCGVINALNAADKMDRYSGGPWAARLDIGVPNAGFRL